MKFTENFQMSNPFIEGNTMQYAGGEYLMKILCVFVSYSTKRGKQLNSQLLSFKKMKNPS